MSSNLDSILRSPKAYQLARKAIEAMEANRVWPTALNFELWMYYVAAKDSEVATKIDDVIRSGAQFTDQVGEQIAAEHLPAAKLSGEILDAGKSLSQELDSVSRAIESARETSEAYGQQLATASQTFVDNESDDVRAMVETLSVATRKVREENQALESQLADTTDELTRMREHLEQVRRDAMTDALTSLANRKAFDEALQRTCEEADKSGAPVTLAVLDIDHFKRFNDTWGHQTGDQVLRYVASVLGRVARDPRVAARYGGEEFAMIFPQETAPIVEAALNSAREEIATRALRRRSTNEDLGAVTISIGLAQRRPGELGACLLGRADEALYVSKRGGRNRVTNAEKLAKAAA